MNKFKFGLIITGAGLLFSLLLFTPSFMRNLLGSSPGVIPFLGLLVFILGTLILSGSYGDKLSHWLSLLVVLGTLFLTIPWGGDYTPINTARSLYLLLGLSSIGSWVYLIYLFKLKNKEDSSNIIH